MAGFGYVLALSCWLLFLSLQGMVQGFPAEATADDTEGRAGDAVYCYEEAGCKQGDHSSWEEGTCTSGKSQSPIDLDSSITVPEDDSKKACTKLKMKEYYTGYKFDDYNVKNKGSTIYVDKFTKPPHFKWPERNNQQYNLVQIHFHWGNRSDVGSEHSINGGSYAMEMHLVHYSSKFKDIGAAVSDGKANNLAVLGFLLDVSPDVTESFLAPIASLLPQIEALNAEKAGTTQWDLSSVIKATKEAFIYEGSLTTPTCNEIVAWFVGKKPIPIAEAEVAAFRKTQHAGGKKSAFTNRIAQPLHERQVRVIEVET